MLFQIVNTDLATKTVLTCCGIEYLAANLQNLKLLEGFCIYQLQPLSLITEYVGNVLIKRKPSSLRTFTNNHSIEKSSVHLIGIVLYEGTLA